MVRLYLVRIEGQMDVGRGEGGRGCHLTQGLPLASGNTEGTKGPSSELEDGIVSESYSTGGITAFFMSVIQVANAVTAHKTRSLCM